MARMDTHRELDIPVGAVVIEAWSDEEGIMISRDAAVRRPRRRIAFRRSGLHVSRRRRVARSQGHGRRAARPRHQGASSGRSRCSRRARSEDGLHEQVLAEGDGDGRAAATRSARPTARPYLNRGWWFPQSLMPDLSMPAHPRLVDGQAGLPRRGLGVDGFKTDGGEHAWGHDLRTPTARGDEGNNLYPVHYAKAFGDLLREHGKAPVTFSRSGFTGSQAHGVFWAGDEDSTWEAFRNSVTAGLTAASCGIVYWGWDLAGLLRAGAGRGALPAGGRRVRRSCRSCSTTPSSTTTSSPLRDRTPWHVAERTGDDRVVPVFRRFAHLRERLVAYLAEQAARDRRAPTDR